MTTRTNKTKSERKQKQNEKNILKIKSKKKIFNKTTTRKLI